MRKMKIAAAVCLLLCLLISMTAALAEEVTITPKKEQIYIAVNKTADIGLTVQPRAARAKGVTYESDDESIATVNSRGRVKGISQGSCNIIVTSKYDTTTFIKIPVSVIVLAKKIDITADVTTFPVGSTAQLFLAFSPEDTSVQEVTYKSTDTRIATVDEKGRVTGVKAGKVSITATATDGSNARGKINLVITQPVTGVTYKTPHVRVGAGYHGTFTATIEPKNVTNKNMTWTSSDPSVATVTGTKNSFKIVGHKWGQAIITGVTEDGGFEVSVKADIGSLRNAIKVVKLSVRNGKPYITLKNNSNLEITQIRYKINGFSQFGIPVKMSRYSDTLDGTYDLPLAPGESTEHGQFYFIHKTNFEGLAKLSLAITGYSTSTGYYNSKGDLCYEYNISPDSYNWIDTN